MKIKLFLLLIMTLISTNSFALNGNELYRVCARNNDINNAACAAYIGGIIDTLRMNKHMKIAYTKLCIPDNLSDQQSKKIVTDYLADHLEEWLTNAAVPVTFSMFDNFECAD